MGQIKDHNTKFDSLVYLGSCTSIAVQIRILKPSAVCTEVSTLRLCYMHDLFIRALCVSLEVKTRLTWT